MSEYVTVGNKVDGTHGGASLEVRGCPDCPCASWDPASESRVCGLDGKLYLPVDDQGDLYHAVPSNCPLLRGATTIKLLWLKA